MISRRLLFLLGLALFSLSCGKNHFFLCMGEIKNTSWTYMDTLTYLVRVEDTTARYNIGLEITHSTAFEYQNLYIKIITVFPDSETLSQTLPIDFADHTGVWYGDCTGDWCKLDVMLQENALFDRIGGHKFKIVQNMRVDPIQGVKQVNLVLDKKS